jgi:hypothetical protein
LVEFEKCLLKYEKKQEKFIKSNFFSDWINLFQIPINDN